MGRRVAPDILEGKKWINSSATTTEKKAKSLLEAIGRFVQRLADFISDIRLQRQV